MRIRWILIGLGSLAILALLAYLIIPRLLESGKKAMPVTWPTESWPTGIPESGGLDSTILADGLQTIEDQHTQIDSLMVIRDGKVLLDADFYPHDSAYLHDLASVTKTFTTTLIGIAVDQGKLKLDDPVLSFFPERTIANRDEMKERMTVRHLVQMRNGLASGCEQGDAQTIIGMWSTPDWVQAALDRKMVAEPGTSYCYDSPGMHLLSAILQKATGMTELEFARQNLFEPLGIKDVYWASDPQGVTRGWGDLHLKPGDAAKLGYLWLNNGVWDGKQVVSADWVKDSIQRHSDFGDGSGYGYGWWLWESGYGASGRGGQSIKVEPGLNVIVITTGGGFDYDTEVGKYLIAALTDSGNPLPENPAEVARLAETVAGLAEPSAPKPVPGLPGLASSVSGKTYIFEPNAAIVESMTLEFNDKAEAVLTLKYVGGDTVTSKVGLDGVYRPTPEGDLKRGSWTDPETFVVEIIDIGRYTIHMRFDGDQVFIKSPEQGVSFEGQVQKP